MDNFVKCNDIEIDQIRQNIKTVKTNKENYEKRAILLKLWVCMLQQQGANMEEYLHVDEDLARLSNYSFLFDDSIDTSLSKEEENELFSVIDEGYTILENIQNNLSDYQPDMTKIPFKGGPKEDIEWALYHGNIHHTGSTGAYGPSEGELNFRLPVGLGWESQPVVEDGVVYVSSPGMRNILYGYDINSGKEVFRANQITSLKGDQLYGTPCNSSTPKIINDHILIRDMGSRGNSGDTKYISVINKKTGDIDRKIEASHIDYRYGYAQFDANEKFIVYPHGIHDIEDTPPVNQQLNTIVCKEFKTGKKRWSFNIGETFSEPLIYENVVIATTRSGYVYALKLNGNYPPASAERIKWEFKASGEVNRKVTAYDNKIIFGDNAGLVYCLDAKDGSLIWKYETDEKRENVFRYFGSPLIENEKVYIPCANSKLYCLDLSNGDLVDTVKGKDSLRSKPVIIDSNIYFTDFSGNLYCADNNGNLLFTKKISTHPIYADLTKYEDKILVNDSSLYLNVYDKDGNEVFKQSLIGSFIDKDGYRIYTEQIAGGAYYQSKPTAADGKLFFGTPSRFLYAVDAETGETIWKNEIGGAISASPVCYNGKIYIGQQGGEDEYYCFDAKTGDLVWTQSIGWVWGSCNADEGRIYIPGIDGFVNCLDAETGNIIWRYRTQRSTCTEPVIDGDFVYFGGWDHYLYAFDKTNGKLRWKFQLSGGSDSGAPVAYEGKIYLPIGGDKFRCLDGKTGKVLWEFGEPGMIFNITAAYHEGKVFLSSWHGLGIGGICLIAMIYCLDANTGELIWKHEGGGLAGPVIGAGKKVYFGSVSTPYVYCVDEDGNSDGTTTCYWRFRMENKLEEPTPCIYKNKLYVLSSDGYIYSIK
ncbi:hypothetical protein SH1V18_07920 [Vallitalea longa]|uniref:Pyrrolo-quinoline quinone repeat domain-containing protein n=1 Tax=Vallitalea longa TaxID=2936439 RepID=A0A9W5Y7K0_9FIRM|nr:PQQ-binding-like beta-propeller repeat protein [Vallitalea longa]GKX28312.1 hypothetical protein SH1V18_07920 [Vallitalea longa]